jgi:hypothetical protein
MDSRERRRRRRLGEWCYTRKQKKAMEKFVYTMRNLGLATIDDSNAMRWKNNGGGYTIFANWSMSVDVDGNGETIDPDGIQIPGNFYRRTP